MSCRTRPRRKDRLRRVGEELRQQYLGDALPPDSAFYDGIAFAYQLLLDADLLSPDFPLSPRPAPPKGTAPMMRPSTQPPVTASPLPPPSWRIVEKGPPTEADTEVLEGAPADDVRVVREPFYADLGRDPTCLLRVHNRLGDGEGQRIARITLTSVHRLDLAFARHMAEAAYAFFAKTTPASPPPASPPRPGHADRGWHPDDEKRG